MKITREREIKIIEISFDDSKSKEYIITENGKKLFGWNNPELKADFITKTLFKPIPEEAK